MADLVDEVENGHDSRIAIVGRAGRFPDAPDVASLWRMLADGRHAMRRLSDADLLAAGVSRKALADPNYVRRACILPDMECFDAGFFGFSPREAAILDPQHRQFLETSWEALEDAAIVPRHFEGRIGVYAGSGMQAYLSTNLLTNPDLVDEVGLFLLRHTGNDKDFLPTRLSYLLNLTGPSVAIQTACSTSLVAVHTAMGALLNMECDLALAGGVTIELPHRVGYRYAEGEILSPDGLCRAFDDAAQGTVFGSGAAIVVLKRYTDAVADGDDIKAVLLGSAVNNDGAGKASYLAPSVEGQAEAAAEALALSGLSAGDIGYVEAHGTGTPIGDPIELAALGEAYGAAAPGSIAVGSVKTNIGHLDTAAGGAGLIKAVEALRRRRLPANLNFKTPNGRYDFGRGPFRVQAEGAFWDSRVPRRAAVNSLGVGGTNAHVIVEEAPDTPPSPGDGAWQVCLFSAKEHAALDRMVPRWTAFLEDAPPPMADIAATLRTGREAFNARMAVAAQRPSGLVDAISSRVSPYLARGTSGDAPSVVFLFPGGGAQYPGAGSGLMRDAPAFKSAVDACFNALPETAPHDLRAMMFERGLEDAEASARIARSSYAIPALFILEYAYARLWESWGIEPDAIVAHSVGEYAGAVISGALGLADALRVVVLRGQVMDSAPEGAMTAVPLGEEEVRARIGADLDVAAVNTDESTVISGAKDEVEAFESRLQEEGLCPQRLRIDVAAHSRHLECQLERFRAGFADVEFGPAQIPMVSSLRGAWATGGDLVSADYWVRHLRETVRFSDAVRTVLDDPSRVVIEVGPGQTLGPFFEVAEARHAPRSVLASAPRPKDDADELGVALAALGGLWVAGGKVDWSRTGAPDGRRISVPTYAFAKDRHWIEPGKTRASDAEESGVSVVTRRSSVDDWFEETVWVPEHKLGARPNGSWLVFAGLDPVSEEVLANLERFGVNVSRVNPGSSFAREDRRFRIRPEEPEDYEQLADALGDLPERVLSLWSFDGATADHFGHAFCLAQMLQTGNSGPVALTFAVPATEGEGGEPLLSPEAMSLVGPVRSAPREITDLKATLVAVDEQSGSKVLSEAAGDLSDDCVAYLGGTRFRSVRRQVNAPVVNDLPQRLREGGVYLVTGGTGGIGREMARWLAGNAKAKLGLLSRGVEADSALVAEIRSLGGEAVVLRADVTDEPCLRVARAALEERFGTVNGVIHAAGIIDDAPLAAKNVSDARAVMAPKLDGAKVLNRVFPDGDVELFAVFSSTSAAIGPPGQADYAGGNAGAEAVALGRRDGLAISWGVWRDLGMAARVYGAGEAVGDPLLGLRSETPEEIRFERVLDPETDWVVAEHRIDGVPVLPGTAYLELVLEAGRAALGTEAVTIRSMSLNLPMLFPEGLPRRVSLVLEPSDNGFALRIESRASAGDSPVEHASALIERCTSDPEPAQTVDPEILASDEGGQAAQSGTLEFGPRWQTQGAVRKSHETVTASVRLADRFEEDLVVHPSHPALVDIAATAGLHLLPEDARQGLVYAPVSFDKVTRFAPLPSQIVVRARQVAGQPRSFAAFDATLHDVAGTCLMQIERLTLRALKPEAFSTDEEPTLTEKLLATGIRRTEAGALFSRVFNCSAKSLTVSPVDLDLVRLALTEAHAVPDPAVAKRGSGGVHRTPVASRLAGLWSEALGVENVGEGDDFFALGGHSLSAVRMFGQVRRTFGVTLPLATLFETPTLGALADLITEHAGPEVPPMQHSERDREHSLVRISRGEANVNPFFMVHGAGGNILNFRALAGFLDPRIPFYGLRAHGSDGGTDVDETIEAMASRYLGEIRALLPHGPYRFGGYSGGGLVAYEMAQMLRAEGIATERVVFFDTLAAGAANRKVGILKRIWAARHWDVRFALGYLARRRQAWRREEAIMEINKLLADGKAIPEELVGYRLNRAFVDAQSRYREAPYDGKVTIFRARRAGALFLLGGPLIGWQGLVPDDTEVVECNCDHFSMMAAPAIGHIGARLNELLLDSSQVSPR